MKINFNSLEEKELNNICYLITKNEDVKYNNTPEMLMPLSIIYNFENKIKNNKAEFLHKIENEDPLLLTLDNLYKICNNLGRGR